MGSQMSAQLNVRRPNNMEGKNKFDVRKLTIAASKLKIHKRKDKVAQSTSNKEAKKEFFNSLESEMKEVDLKVEEPTQPKQQPTCLPVVTRTSVPRPESSVTETKDNSRTAVAPSASASVSSTSSSSRGIRVHSRHVLATTRQEKRWPLTDLLQNFGVFVQNKCSHLSNPPSATEVAMWVRCADRALHLNGWTINSFLLESHVVFSYMLVAFAFETYNVRTLADAKELVLMCLYISYTYNANEISYPLRPFLVKLDTLTFWDKCLDISLSASGMMLRLNRDAKYYADTLASLKCIHTFC